MDPRRIWFDPPHVRWGRVVATVLVASTLVGLWVAQRRGLFDAAPERVVPAISPQANAIAASGASPSQAAAPGTAFVATAPTRAASSVEIYCGMGAVGFDPSDEAQWERIKQEANERLQAHRARVLPGWLEEMKSSADEQVQAAAWFLEARDVWLQRTESAQPLDSLDALNELVRLAQRTRDPLPYSLAFQSCEIYRGRGAVPACAALSVEAWAERDPGNAFPWLFAAGQDTADARQRARYVDNVLASEFVRGSRGMLYPVMAKAAPVSEAPLDRSVRFFEALSADSFVSVAQGGVIAHCKENDLRNGARRQQCEHLAAFLTDKADSFFEAGLGSSIGKRLGWSGDRVARLKAGLQALQQATPDGAAMAGCDGLARAEAYFADVARYGELGALRRRQQAASAAAR